MADYLRLGDHCDKIGSGATPRGGKDSYLPVGPYALIRSQNIYNTGFVREGLAFISEEQAAKLQNVEVLSGDVLLNITGDSVARACQVDMDILPARVNQHVAILRPRPDEIDARFLRYWLVTPKTQERLLGLASAGATRNALTKSMIEDLRIPRVGIQSQRTIGAILGAFEDKIELNCRMNETLESITRAIFKNWFLDFGPVRAKMKDRNTGLAHDLSVLFPEKLVQRDCGEMPEGWHYAKLSTIASELRRGLSPKYLESGGVCVINQRCIRHGKVLLRPSRRHDPKARSIKGRELKEGDVLVNSTGVGTLGRVAQIWSIEKPTIVDSHVTVVRANGTDVSPIYLGQNLISRESEIETLGEGSTGQTELSRARLSDLEILVPTKSIIEAFDDLTRPLINRVQLNDQQSQTLATLRDLLLPKLMSGEIRVRDAEKLVGEAGV